MVCSYGVNFQRVEDDFLIFGIFVHSSKINSAGKNAIRRNAGRAVSENDVIRVIGAIDEADRDYDGKIDDAKKEIISSYVAEKRFELEYLESMKPIVQRNLSFLHDYSQFVSSVKQNINVVLHTRYPNGDLENKLSRATEAEAAIYWSSALMGEKLTTAFLLLHPEKIVSSETSIFKLHGLVLKYVKIYNAAYRAKQVKLDLTGYSIGEIKAASAVLSVIPHTFLDNALKYSRAGSRVVASFEESWSSITFSVTSYGPKIDDDEKEKIFDIFYRGRHAEAQEDGSGFGLHLAQFIAHKLGTAIKMVQSHQSNQFGYETTFSVSFERER
jgi:signal transduction histidine kinase